jgi:hypothetical protein
MASDFKITYEQIRVAQGDMKRVSDNAVTEINRLKAKVDTLLKPGAGLWLRMSSDDLNAKYKTLSDDLAKAVAQIIVFSGHFDKIVEAAKTLDSKMKEALAKSA